MAVLYGSSIQFAFFFNCFDHLTIKATNKAHTTMVVPIKIT